MMIFCFPSNLELFSYCLVQYSVCLDANFCNIVTQILKRNFNMISYGSVYKA